MTQTIDTVVAGHTAPRRWTLTADNSAIDGTGLTVSSVLLTSVDGQPVDTSGKFGWEDQTTGKVYYNPATTDFTVEKSPYRVRVVLTDGSGKTLPYPESFTAEIKVLSARA